LSQPYAFINEPLQTYSDLKAKLGLPPGNGTKFDVLNSHVRNTLVMPGQLILMPDTTSPGCTAEEAWLMRSANEVKHAIFANQLGSDGFVLKNHDLLQSLLGYTALGVGASSGAWNKHLLDVSSTLEEIEALHKQYLRSGTGVRRNEFLDKRGTLFKKLETQLQGVARYGTGLQNNSSIKKMLNISTRRYEFHGEIRQYAARMQRMAKIARLLKKGTYVGWALDTTASALEIEEACSTGREDKCVRATFVETGKLVGGIAMSTSGGTIGAGAMGAVCVAIGIPSGGLGSLACAVIGGAAGGMAGGMIGQPLGEHAGNHLYRATTR